MSHACELYLFHLIVLAVMRNLLARQEVTHAMRLPWLALFVAVSEPANRVLRAWYSRRTGAAVALRTGG